MKKQLIVLILTIILGEEMIAQQITSAPYSIGTVKSFTEQFMKINVNTKTSKDVVPIAVGNNRSFDIEVNINDKEEGNYKVIGAVKGYEHATFAFYGNDKHIEGHIYFLKTKEAYNLITDKKGNVVITSTDITKIIGWDEYEHDFSSEEPAPQRVYSSEEIIAAQKYMVIPQHESMPEAKGVLYLDFDGEVSKSEWNSGNTINAAALNWATQNPQNITNAWKMVAEDYGPYQVNVTTIREKYDNAPKDQRMMCIYTTTKTAAPQFGGVAYIGSFSDGKGNPCWAYFNQEFKGEAETGVHEFGHTVGLQHDGDSKTGQDYYLGHGQWGPIMGASYGPTKRPISQFSKGEYTGATNTTQDDVQTIPKYIKAGFKVDQHSNTITGATRLKTNGAGVVKDSENIGIIEQRTDKDVFTFKTSGGDVKFEINPADDFLDHPDLDIQARLLDSQGTELALSNPTGMNAVIEQKLAAGTYYIEIDGVGFGNPLNTGYSDYGSVGYFDISGFFPELATDIQDKETAGSADILVFPSPTKDLVNIVFPSAEKNEVFIFNCWGEAVYQNNSVAGGWLAIDLQEQANGVYFVKARSGNQLLTKKVIIAK